MFEFYNYIISGIRFEVKKLAFTWATLFVSFAKNLN